MLVQVWPLLHLMTPFFSIIECDRTLQALKTTYIRYNTKSPLSFSSSLPILSSLSFLSLPFSVHHLSVYLSLPLSVSPSLPSPFISLPLSPSSSHPPYQVGVIISSCTHLTNDIPGIGAEVPGAHLLMEQLATVTHTST